MSISGLGMAGEKTLVGHFAGIIVETAGARTQHAHDPVVHARARSLDGARPCLAGAVSRRHDP